jgi:putative DNA primase/helicase
VNALKDYMIFCAENPHLSERAQREAFEQGTTPIEVHDGRDLDWRDIDTITNGQVGVFNVPCPYCGGGDSTRLRIERDSLSFARWRCFYCGRYGAASADGVVDPAKESEARRKAKQRAKELRAGRVASALRVWDQAGTIERSPAIDYLHARAITELPPDLDGVLRWHPRCPFGAGQTAACMVALYRDARSNEPVAILRTRVSKSGKAQRMSLGPIARAVVKLWPESGDQLVIGEGIETVLAAAQATWNDIPLKPAWATTVARNMEKFPLVRGVKSLIVLGDNDQDKSHTGYQKAYEVYSRWKLAGRQARILMPRLVGADFNDLVKDYKDGFV